MTHLIDPLGTEVLQWVSSLINAGRIGDTAEIIRLYSKVSSKSLPILEAIGETAVERAIEAARKNHRDAAETILTTLSPFHAEHYSSHSYLDLTGQDGDPLKENTFPSKIQSYQTFSPLVLKIPKPIRDESKQEQIDPINLLTLAVLSKDAKRVKGLLAKLVISRLTLGELIKKATRNGIDSREGRNTLAVLLTAGPLSTQDRDAALERLENSPKKNRYTEDSKELLNKASIF